MGVCCIPQKLECRGNETRMPLKCIRNRQNPNSNAYKTTLGCIFNRPKPYSNARKRNSDAFENEKNHIRIHENQYSNAYLSFWFIYFGPTVMDVGHPPCGISVHPVSISAGPALISGGPTSMWYGPDSIGLSIGQQSLSDGPSFKSSTCDLFVSVWSNGLVYYPGCRHAIRIGLHCDSPATPSSLSVFR